MLSYEAGAKPYIQWNHIDGALLTCSDGTPHWLTLIERLLVKSGFMSIEQLDNKYNSEPRKG